MFTPLNRPGRELTTNLDAFRVEQHVPEEEQDLSPICNQSVQVLDIDQVTSHNCDSEPYLRVARIHNQGKTHGKDTTIDLATKM